MKILLINHFPLTGSGSGVYTLNVAHALREIGHEVCLVFPENQIDAADYPFKTHPVYFTGATEPQPGALPFNFPCFTTHPRSVNTFEALSDAEFDCYLQAFRGAIAQEVEAFQPDIIHAGHIWLLPWVASEFDIPVVITAHGTDLMGFRQSERFRDYARQAAERAAAIVTISQKNSDEVAECFPFATDKTFLLMNGYNSNVFYPDTQATKESVLAEFGIERSYEHLVSFAGKFTTFKGIDTLLRAAAVYEDDQTATLLAGDGELFEPMNQLAAELGLKNVYFLHNQPHDKLRRLYSVADVSTVPSRNEPFGLVVIEAGACGAPVVGSDSGGIKDILVPETGIMFPTDDGEAMGKTVRSILDGDRVFDRQVVAEYTKKHFSQAGLIGQLVDVYQGALK